jgi:8-oxo-dGTP diphosphatase
MITCQFEDGNPAALRHVVIDTIVLQEDKVLMVKRTDKLLEGGKWGLVGGFAERDETLLEAVAREVYEETGWEIKNIILLAINDQAGRPKEDRQNISFVYFCEAVEQTGKPDWESDDQQWFSFDQLPDHESIAFDHADDIDLYLRYKKDSLTLPVFMSAIARP